MKSFSEYIKESLKESIDSNKVVLKNMQVKYSGPDNIAIQVPVSYSESDIQIYLEDIWLNQLPGGKEAECNEMFGSNIKNISDAYLEWYSIDTIEDSNTYDIEWDNSYGSSNSNNSDDTELHIVNIKNISYILEFTQFVLTGVTDETYADKLNDLFEQTVADNYKYPFELSINTANLIFRK